MTRGRTVQEEAVKRGKWEAQKGLKFKRLMLRFESV